MIAGSYSIHRLSASETVDKRVSDPTLERISPLSVIVCHAEELFRAGLTQHLRSHPDIAVVGSVRCNDESLKLCQRHAPRVFLCDAGGARLSIEEFVCELRGISPDTRLLLIGRDSHDPEAALRAGAWGIISPDSPGLHFARAIRVVASGQYWVERNTLERLARRALTLEGIPKKEKPLLSPREVEILRLVSAGKTNDGIAEALFVEPNTVRTHLRRIYRKLEVHDRTSAVMAASRIGLMKPDD